MICLSRVYEDSLSETTKVQVSVRLFRYLFVLIVAPAHPLQAQVGEELLDGKTITFLVGSSAGGGTDVTARLIARHIERTFPGKPRIDVANKPARAA